VTDQRDTLKPKKAAKYLGNCEVTGQQFTAATIAAFKVQYSREEAAEVIGISLRTLDRLIADKELPVRRIGRRVFINRDILYQWLKRDHPTGLIQ
jgi:excisionase family DNA binding protein